MNDVGDALKAVEDLTEIVRDMLTATPVFYSEKAATIERLNNLRMGCEALRAGMRGSSCAQKILGRAAPAMPGPDLSPCGDIRAMMRKCSSHPGLSIEEKRPINPLLGAAEGCDECLTALIDQVIGWTRPK